MQKDTGHQLWGYMDMGTSMVIQWFQGIHGDPLSRWAWLSGRVVKMLPVTSHSGRSLCFQGLVTETTVNLGELSGS